MSSNLEHASQLLSQAFLRLREQQTEAAQVILDVLLKDYPNWSSSYALQAALAIQTNDMPVAERAFSRALSLDPQNSEYALNLLKTLMAQKKKKEFIEVCHTLVISPADEPFLQWTLVQLMHVSQADALDWVLNREYLYKTTQEAYFYWLFFKNESKALAHRFILNMPSQLAVRYALVEKVIPVLIEEQSVEHLPVYFKLAIDKAPQLRALAFKILMNHWKQLAYSLALPYFEICEPYLNEFAMPDHRYYRDWALSAHRSGLTEMSAQLYTKAEGLAPNPLFYAFDKLMRFPRIYESETEILRFRENFLFTFSKLEKKLFKLQKQKLIDDICITYPFGLSYQGLNDRPIIEKLGQLWHRCLFNSDLPQKPDHLPRAQPPYKIAFVSMFFYNHSVLKAYGDVIQELAQEPLFDVHILHLGHIVDDKTKKLKQSVHKFAHIQDMQKALRQIKAWQVDILIYPDIGMSGMSYIMAFHRLAPIQGVFAGHPATTGIPNIDYFYSKQDKEIEKADAHYTETLVRLPGHKSKHAPIIAPPKVSRQDIGWPEDRHIYFCPMALFKIHPSFDAAIAGILSKDPKASVWFVKSKTEPELEGLLMQRFEKSMPKRSARIHFQPWMNTERFYQALQNSDLVLDPFCFGSGTTTRAILGLNQLMVTMPKAHLRARMVQAYFKDPYIRKYVVADSPNDYISKAVELVTNIPLRNEVKKWIAANQSLWFGPSSQTGYTCFKQHLIEAVKAYPQKIDKGAFTS